MVFISRSLRPANIHGMFGPEIIVKTYRMPIAATPAQISAFCQISGCCRLVYNWALDWRKAHIATSPRDENGKISPLSKNDQLNGLPALKKIRTFLKDCPSQALQAAIGDLHEGVSRYLSGQNEAPTWRRKSDPESFRFPQGDQFSIRKIPREVVAAGGIISRGGARFRARYLHAPKFGMTRSDNGPIEIVVHQPIKGKMKTCTIKRSGDRFYACITTEIRRKDIGSSADRLTGAERMIETDPTLGAQTRKPPPKKKSDARHAKWLADRNERKAKSKRSRAAQSKVVAERAKSLGRIDARALADLRVMSIDRNVTYPFVTSDGDIFGEIALTPQMKRRMAKLQRAIARKEEAMRKANGRAPGASLRGLATSVALKRARRKLAELHAHIARKRKDAIHKITSWMVERADIFAIEDLEIASMTASARGTTEEPGKNVSQKSGLNTAILDRGWGEFVRQLEYKCRWASRRHGAKKILLRVRPAYTSQRCFACKSVDGESRSGGIYHCTTCGHTDHADINAARNIRELGLEDLARACDLDLEDLPADLLGRDPVEQDEVPADGRCKLLEGEAVRLPLSTDLVAKEERYASRSSPAIQ